MARPGVKSYPQARALSASPFARIVLVLDVLAHLVVLAVVGKAAAAGALATTWTVVVLVLAALTVVASLGSLGLRARSRVWRGRLCAAALLVAIWRGGPLDDDRVAILATVLWSGLVWITLLVEGRRVSAAVVEATGEEGLGDDPSRHL